MRIVSGLNRLPTGCCIQALAIRIQRAEKFEPNATHQVTARWPDLLSRSHPKKNNPMKVASRKNAIRPCNGERRAEHVADVVREVGPVRAELKFHGNSGRDSHRKIDAKQDAPKHRHVAPDAATGHDIDAFHDREEHGKPSSTSCRRDSTASATTVSS